MHERFNREVWTFKSDFTGALAKCLVRQSPYTVPDKLSECLVLFDEKLDQSFDFDTAGMAKISLVDLTGKINEILESIPEIMELNNPKTGHTEHIFTSRYNGGPENPDDDFIDIMAVAQNIRCEFADKADVNDYLESRRIE